MSGFKIDPLRIRLGGMELDMKVYVAQLQDQMLLGMEFLYRQ